MGDYQRLNTEAEAEIHLHASAPNQRINKVYYARPMTPVHKATFASSIVFIVIVVLFFIWGLPCNVYECTKDQTQSISWDKTLSGIELKGRMHVVGGNLIAICRKARWGIVPNRLNSGGGVVALKGRNGDEIYSFEVGVMPRHIDCSLLDLISNNAKTCLIVGEKGYMGALDTVSGLIIWRLNPKSFLLPDDVDVPLSIPDVNNDGHVDLVALSRTKHGIRVTFVSGFGGEVIAQPPVASDCTSVSSLNYDYNTASLSYDCSSAESLSEPIKKKLSLEDLFPHSVANSNMMGRVMIPDDEKMRFVEGNSSAGEHKVVVTNRGECPHNCYATVNVTDCQNNSVWSYQNSKTYIMYPISLHFKHSITGFLLKLWQWHTPSHGNTIDGNENIRVELIKERIVLITFNKSELHLVNASQTDIVQLCQENECQPHLSFQTQSATIADLNGDGAQDLISYFVTYNTNNEDPLQATGREALDKWVLESRVRVVRLEAELPKLYDTVSVN